MLLFSIVNPQKKNKTILHNLIKLTAILQHKPEATATSIYIQEAVA